MRTEGLARQMVIVTQKLNDLGSRAREILADYVDLGTIARREDHRFGRRGAGRKRFDGRSYIPAREVETLAQLDRRRSMTHAEQEKMH